jgi:hypothetical protein
VPIILPISRDHNRSGFDCGVPELNTFLKTTARQHDNKGISRTFVLSEPEKPTSIHGYFTLTLCEIHMEQLPVKYARKYPAHGLTAARLARLAVDLKSQRKGYDSLFPYIAGLYSL